MAPRFSSAVGFGLILALVVSSSASAGELRLTFHILRRMGKRGFTEPDLQSMLQEARGWRPDIVEDRWIVTTWHRRRRWEVIVEPEPESRLLVAVTAYPLGESP